MLPTISTSISKLAAGSPPSGGNDVSAWLGRSALAMCGWKIEGELPQHPKMVFAIGPHTTNWDFFLGIAVLFALRIRIRFLGKHSIFVPVAKQCLEALGGMPVNRASSNGVVAQVVAEFEQSEKMILAVAPEGTRSPIFPWKSGFLAIAYKANVPVLLIGFDFAEKRVRLGPVIHSEGDIAADMQQVYDYFATVPAKHPHKVLFEEKKS